MTHEFQLLNALLTLIGIVSLAWFFYGPWQRLVVDMVRQHLFELRDLTFDAAARGQYSFDAPQYLLFRDFINTMIRNSPRTTVWRYIAYAGFSGMGSKKFATHFTKYLTGEYSIPLIHKQFDRACIWITLMLWLRSPVLMVFTILLSAALPIIVIGAMLSTRIRHFPKLIGTTLKRLIQSDAAIEIVYDDNCSIL